MNDNLNSHAVVEEKDFASDYLKKKNKKKIITIILVIILTAVLAVTLYFTCYTTKTFKLNSIKWGISSNYLKLICRAELLVDSDDRIGYKYDSFEKLGDILAVEYNFEDDKLFSISVNSIQDVNETAKNFVKHFDAKGNGEFDVLYAEYDDCNIYFWLDNGGHISIHNKNSKSYKEINEVYKKVDFDTVDEEDFEIDDETEKLILKAKDISSIDVDNIHTFNEYVSKFGEYVTVAKKLDEAQKKYPYNNEIENLLYDLLYEKSDIWEKKGDEFPERANSLIE